MSYSAFGYHLNRFGNHPSHVTGTLPIIPTCPKSQGRPVPRGVVGGHGAMLWWGCNQRLNRESRGRRPRLSQGGEEEFCPSDCKHITDLCGTLVPIPTPNLRSAYAGERPGFWLLRSRRNRVSETQTRRCLTFLCGMVNSAHLAERKAQLNGVRAPHRVSARSRQQWW